MLRWNFILPLLIINFVFFSHFFAIAQSTLTSGSIIYCPGNGDFKNISPNRIEGTDGIVHGATQSFDRYGKANAAFMFNGRDHFIAIEDDLALSDYAIGFWYNTTSSSKSQLLDWADGALQVRINESRGRGKIAVILQDGTTKSIRFSSKRQTNDGRWHHLLIAFTDATLKVYEDGHFAYEKSLSLSKKKKSLIVGAMLMGKASGETTHHYQGRIDDLLVYNRALSEEEIGIVTKNADVLFDSPITKGLIYYYPFEGTSLNSSENTLCQMDGRVEGASLSFDRFEQAQKAYHFDGIHNRIVIDHTARHPHLTACFWFNTNTAIASNILGWTAGGFNFSVNPVNGSGKLKAELAISNTKDYSFISSKVVTDGKWHFVSITFDGFSFRAYLDGQLIFQDVQLGEQHQIFYREGQLEIGAGNRANGYSNYQGRIDDVRIYNTAFNASVISALYNEELRKVPVKISSKFDQNQTVQVEFDDEISGRAEIEILGRKGQQISKERKRIRSRETQYFDLSAYDDNHFSVKVKVDKQTFYRKITFCNDQL